MTYLPATTKFGKLTFIFLALSLLPAKKGETTVDNLKTPPQWQVLGKSIRGASHERKGLENQDHIDYTRGPDGELPFCLAISDGHGSKKHFRSATGSHLAVGKALAVLKEFENSASSRPLSELSCQAVEELPQKIFNEWRQAVEADFKSKPLAEDPRFKKLSVEQQSSVQADPFIAYGATLLAVLVTSTYILYLQLGDGDIVCVNSFGEVSRPLHQESGVMTFNETYSLSQENAWQKFEVELLVEYSDVRYFPVLICVSTDGLFNSFADNAGFEKVAQDYSQLLANKGLEAVEATVEETLKCISAGGSGDEISLGILYRLDPNTFDYPESVNVEDPPLTSINAEVQQQWIRRLQEDQSKQQQEIVSQLESFEEKLSKLSPSIEDLKRQNFSNQRQQALMLSVGLLLGTLVGAILAKAYFLPASLPDVLHPAADKLHKLENSSGQICKYKYNPFLSALKTMKPPNPFRYDSKRVGQLFSPGQSFRIMDPASSKAKITIRHKKLQFTEAIVHSGYKESANFLGDKLWACK